MLRFFLAIALTGLLPVVAMAEKISGSDYMSGPWFGAAYTSDETGTFSHCAVSARYPHNSTDLYFYLNKNYTMTIGVYDNLGRFPPNQQFQVNLKVDRKAPFSGFANAVSKNSAFVTLTDMNAALAAMKKGNVLVIEGLYGNFSYALNGTYRALDAAYSCASQYYNFSSQVKDESQSGWLPTREQERKMFQLASAIAADFGQTGIQFRDSVKNAVIWDAQDGNMWVSTAIGRNEGRKVDLAVEFGSDMTNLSSWCSGSLGTVQTEYTAANVVTNETEAFCQSENADDQFKVHIIRQVVDSELYEIVLYFKTGKQRPPSSKSMPDQSAARAAATIAASYSVD